MRKSKYTNEFRDSTVQLAINSEKSVLQIGKDLDVNPKTIYNWIKVYKTTNNMPVESSTKITPKETLGLIWHSDRGSQYASYSHRDLLSQHDIVQSMSRKGNCWDNAVAESFFHTLKTELTHHEVYETRAEANQSIFEYIEVFYNRQRMHSTNNNLSPVEYEEFMLLNEIVA